jgi:hypothetical protein
VIGTTTSTANAFDSLPSARCFTYTAGAAAVVATVGADHSISQRFYRARPTTNPINSSASIYGGPATPTQNESRNRAAASLREAGLGASPHASPATTEWSDSPNNRAWTAREKIKAATCVSFSPDGKFLAVGEVSCDHAVKPRTAFANICTDWVQTSCTHLLQHCRCTIRHTSDCPRRALLWGELRSLQSRFALPCKHRDSTRWLPVCLEHQSSHRRCYPSLQQQVCQQHQPHDMDGQQTHYVGLLFDTQY